MYLIDSDVFIDAKNRLYGFDIVPAFWTWVEQQHRAGRVYTVQRVADEVLAGGDELADWMTAQPASFRLPARPEHQPALQIVDQWGGASPRPDQACSNAARTRCDSGGQVQEAELLAVDSRARHRSATVSQSAERGR